MLKNYLPVAKDTIKPTIIVVMVPTVAYHKYDIL